MKIDTFNQELEKINNKLVEFVKQGYLDVICYYIKDLAYYDLDFYFDPQYLLHDDDLDDPEKFDIYNQNYIHLDELGTIVGTLNKDGYSDLHKNMIPFSYVKEEKYPLNYKTGETGKYTYDSIGYRDIDKKKDNLDIDDEKAFFKINEAILLLLIQAITSSTGVETSIKEIQKCLENEIFDGYITIISRYLIDNLPFEDKLLGFDTDEFDTWLPHSSQIKTFDSVERISSRIRSFENKIKSLSSILVEISPIFRKYGIEINYVEINSNDFFHIATCVEEVFTVFYKKNFEKVFQIALSLKSIVDEETVKLVDLIEKYKVNLEFNGFWRIIRLIDCILVPYFERMDLATDAKNEIIKRYIPMKFAGNLRNLKGHKSYELSPNTILIGVNAISEFLYCIDELSMLFSKI